MFSLITFLLNSVIQLFYKCLKDTRREAKFWASLSCLLAMKIAMEWLLIKMQTMQKHVLADLMAASLLIGMISTTVEYIFYTSQYLGLRIPTVTMNTSHHFGGTMRTGGPTRKTTSWPALDIHMGGETRKTAAPARKHTTSEETLSLSLHPVRVDLDVGLEVVEPSYNSSTKWNHPSNNKRDFLRKQFPWPPDEVDSQFKLPKREGTIPDGLATYTRIFIIEITSEIPWFVREREPFHCIRENIVRFSKRMFRPQWKRLRSNNGTSCHAFLLFYNTISNFTSL